MMPDWLSWVITVGGVLFGAGVAWGTIRTSVGGLRARVTRLENELKSSRDDSQTDRTRHIDDSEQLGERLSQLDGRVRSAEAELGSHQQRLSNLHQQLLAGDQGTAQAHHRIDQLNGELHELIRNLDTLRSELRTLQAGISTRLDYLAKTELIVTDLMVKSGQIRTALDRAEKDIQRQTDGLTGVEKRVATVEGGCVRHRVERRE